MDSNSLPKTPSPHLQCHRSKEMSSAPFETIWPLRQAFGPLALWRGGSFAYLNGLSFCTGQADWPNLPEVEGIIKMKVFATLGPVLSKSLLRLMKAESNGQRDWGRMSSWHGCRGGSPRLWLCDLGYSILRLWAPVFSCSVWQWYCTFFLSPVPRWWLWRLNGTMFMTFEQGPNTEKGLGKSQEAWVVL